jgi:hypothetical protein
LCVAHYKAKQRRDHPEQYQAAIAAFGVKMAAKKAADPAGYAEAHRVANAAWRAKRKASKHAETG